MPCSKEVNWTFPFWRVCENYARQRVSITARSQKSLPISTGIYKIQPGLRVRKNYGVVWKCFPFLLFYLFLNWFHYENNQSARQFPTLIMGNGRTCFVKTSSVQEEIHEQLLKIRRQLSKVKKSSTRGVIPPISVIRRSNHFPALCQSVMTPGIRTSFQFFWQKNKEIQIFLSVAMFHPFNLRLTTTKL